MYDVNCITYDHFYDNPEEIRKRALYILYNKVKEYTNEDESWHFNDLAGDYDYIPGCSTTNNEFVGSSFYTTPIVFEESPMNKIKSILDKEIIMMNENNQSFVLSSCISYPIKTVIPDINLNYELYDHWEGYLFLNPDPPANSGVSLLKNLKYNCDSVRSILNVKKEIQQSVVDDLEKECDDMSKWELDTNIGNTFNRLVLVKRDLFHTSTMNFGLNLEDSKLVQYFSFSTLK